MRVVNVGEVEAAETFPRLLLAVAAGAVVVVESEGYAKAEPGPLVALVPVSILNQLLTDGPGQAPAAPTTPSGSELAA